MYLGIDKFYHLKVVEMNPLLLPVCLKIWLVLRATVEAYPGGHYRRGREACDDIAIIGAGIAGTYTAWKLRNLRKRVTIYEYSDRVGGRLYTYNFPEAPDINVELGAMRYMPDEHPILHNLIRKLGLSVRKFKQGKGPSSDTLLYLRGKHLKYSGLGGSDTPYNLLDNERKHVDILNWETFKYGTNIDDIVNPQEYDIKTKDGVHLYKQSTLSMLHKTRSQEAIRYILDTSGFPRDMEKDNAIYTILAEPPDKSEPIQEVLTVASGLNSIPATLLDQFLKANLRHKLRMNHHLQSIRRRRNGVYNLFFEPTKSVDGYTMVKQGVPKEVRCARKVVLATNRMSLEKLDWSGVQQPHIKEIVRNAVEDVPAVKIFYTYQTAWWERSPIYNIYSISDTPLTQTYEFGTSMVNTPVSVLLASYTDITPVLWREIIQRQMSSSSCNNLKVLHNVSSPEIHFQTNKYLSQLYKIQNFKMPLPISGVIGIWDSYPFGGGWQIHKPGYNLTEIEKAMIKPSKLDDVFVVSNAFNSRATSGWSEGALQSVELAMPHLGRNSEWIYPTAKQMHHI